MPCTPRDSASWLAGSNGRGFTDTLGNRSSSCSIGLCPGGGGSSNSATRREGKPRHLEPQLDADRGLTLIPLILPPFPLFLPPEDTHIPIVLSVIVSVSVVLIISPVESVIISSVSIVEITVPPSVSRLPPVLLPVGPVVVASALPAHWKRNGERAQMAGTGPGSTSEWKPKKLEPKAIVGE